MRSLFGSKWKRRGIHLKEVKKEDLQTYIQLLASRGFYQFGSPLFFRTRTDRDTLRETALQYALRNGVHLVVEVEDPDTQLNPFNPYKFYMFQYHGSPPVPEPPDPQAAPARAPASGPAARQAPVRMAVTCPYCNKVFEADLTPGQSNTLTCPFCHGQSVLDLPPEGAGGVDVSQQLAGIRLKGSYENTMEMIRDCLEVLSQILMIEPTPLPFQDTGEHLYPFCVIKRKAYQHIGFRDMDIILLKEAVHDYKIIGSEVHTQSQRNIAPHRDELFAIKTLGGYTYMILEGYKEMDNKQKSDIANALYEFLSQYVSAGQ
ncbi:MAG: hypothetical protein DRN55_04105 [Thermoplasmata archaeon]|nr:MAG: hypothetical protein DRN55_04105 [Thermoplasmata archaeon]